MKNKFGLDVDNEILGDYTCNTELRYSNGGNDFFLKTIPKYCFGIHALVLYKDEYHLMHENKYNYFTVGILTKSEIKILHEATIKLSKLFIFKSNNRVILKNTNTLLSRVINENMKFKLKNNSCNGIYIALHIKNNRHDFDAMYINEFIDLLDIN